MSIWIPKEDGRYIYSCQASPSLTLAEFKDMLGRLVVDAKGRKPKVIAGGFNAWATELGSSLTNAKGRCLLEDFVQLDIILANDQVNTYRKKGSGSVLDLTFGSPSLAIAFDLKRKSSGWKSARPRMRRTSGWSAKAIDEQTFIDVWWD